MGKGDGPSSSAPKDGDFTRTPQFVQALNKFEQELNQGLPDNPSARFLQEATFFEESLKKYKNPAYPRIHQKIDVAVAQRAQRMTQHPSLDQQNPEFNQQDLYKTVFDKSQIFQQEQERLLKQGVIKQPTDIYKPEHQQHFDAAQKKMMQSQSQIRNKYDSPEYDIDPETGLPKNLLPKDR